MQLDGTKVRRARERLGLSQRALAEEAGVSPGTVVRADHGREAQPSTARKLARTLSVKVVDLMREDDLEETDRAA